MRVEGGYTWKKANRIRFRRGTFCPSAAADHRPQTARGILPCTIVPYFPNCKKSSLPLSRGKAGGNLILTGGAAQPSNWNLFCVLRYISKGYFCVINGLYVPGVQFYVCLLSYLTPKGWKAARHESSTKEEKDRGGKNLSILAKVMTCHLFSN